MSPPCRRTMRATVASPTAGAFKFLRAMEALEDAEKIAGVLHVESDTIVPRTRKDGGVISLHRFLLPMLNARIFATARVFGGVGQQVDENLFDKSRIAVRGRQRFGVPLDFAVGVVEFDVSQRAFHERRQFHALAGEFFFSDTAEVEQVVHQMAHVP